MSLCGHCQLVAWGTYSGFYTTDLDEIVRYTWTRKRCQFLMILVHILTAAYSAVYARTELDKNTVGMLFLYQVICDLSKINFTDDLE